MTLRTKRLADITEADLRALIERGVSEGRDIDYKISRPGNSDGDKREFLYDVSSFANCIGGDLVLGVQENQGAPVAVPGLQVSDMDAEKLRLENLIRDGIRPRIIPSVAIQPVALSNSNVVVIVRVSRSLAQPHAVTLGGSFRFYSRNSAGKYPLDIGEVRNAFIGSQEVVERLRRFRLDRIAIITANEAPVELPDSGKLIVHIVPFRVFEPGTHYDVTTLVEERFTSLRPIGSSSDGIRHNFDGLLSFTTRGAVPHPGYLQVFRNGAIEAVDTYLLREGDGHLYIQSIAYEEQLIEAIGRFLVLQRVLGVDPPLAVMITLVGVKGYRMGVHKRIVDDPGVPIDRDLLLIPEVVVEGYDVNTGRTIRPIFDAIWSAAGWPRSLNYDANGNWRRFR